MTPLTRELLVYSLQIGILVTAGAVALHAFDVPDPQARLVCWRVLLVVCLLLPLWPARVVHVATPPGAELLPLPYHAIAAAASAAGLPSERPSVTLASLINLLPLLIVAGAVARGAWLTA